MKATARCWVFATVLATQMVVVQVPAKAQVAPDSEIRRILVDRIDKYRQSVGIVVGVIEPQGRRVVAYRSLDQGDPRPLSGDTIFEVDSITKVFTSLLLADMVQRGEVALTDPVAKYLPGNVKVPERGGNQITLMDLATHRSGLPQFPPNGTLKETHPLLDYTAGHLYSLLSSCGVSGGCVDRGPVC